MPPMGRHLVCGGLVLCTLLGAGVAGAASASDGPNPLAVYPRRPGAKFEDREARVGQQVHVAGLDSVLGGGTGLPYDLVLDRVEVEPRSVVPAGWVRPTPVENFVAHPKIDGDVLHLVVRASLPQGDGILRSDLSCTATDPADGAELLPLAAPIPKNFAPPPSTNTPTTVAPQWTTRDAYIPVGARRGPMYVSCSLQSVFAFMYGGVVWRVDVR
jgi:hypothetical protein